MIKKERNIKISQLKKGKQLLRIKSRRDNKLLRKSLIKYLKDINRILMEKKCQNLGLYYS